jgi:AcrR family transcriptional regulator
MQVVPIRSKPRAPEGRRAEVKAQNRRIILDAARRVFAELGYSATKVRDIIRATPLAAGTFYNYFRTKEEVLEALCAEAAHVLAPALRESRAKAKSAEAFFFTTFSTFFGLIADRNASGLGPMMHQESTALVSVGLKDDIGAAITRGVLPATDPELLTAGICGLASALADAVAAGASADGMARTATAFILDGFRAFAPEKQQIAVNY